MKETSLALVRETLRSWVRAPLGVLVVGPDVKMESKFAFVAQSEEHPTFNRRVARSKLAEGSCRWSRRENGIQKLCWQKWLMREP